MINSNKEVTLKTRETYFLYSKPQKLKIAKLVSKKRKVASYRRNNNLGVSFKYVLR